MSRSGTEFGTLSPVGALVPHQGRRSRGDGAGSESQKSVSCGDGADKIASVIGQGWRHPVPCRSVRLCSCEAPAKWGAPSSPSAPVFSLRHGGLWSDLGREDS